MKQREMLAYTPVELNYLETLAKTFIISARQNQFIQENIFNNAPVRRIAIAMNTNSASTGTYTQNPFWFQQFDLRQIRILRRDQRFLNFDADDIFRLFVTTMEAMNLQDYVFRNPIDNFKEQFALVFDFTSLQVVAKNCHYSDMLENHWIWRQTLLFL